MAATRHSTGIETLDKALGGGLIPGTLTVLVGATGIGKTQLSLSYCNVGAAQEGERGIIFDLTTRGDSQNQPEYARRIHNWTLRRREFVDRIDPAVVWNADEIRSDYLHVFYRGGRRVTIGDMEPEQWQEFKADLIRRLDQTIAFFYGNFVLGVRRAVIDGIEPVERDADSFQFHMFDYVYHQILRKEHDWLARDLFRVRYRSQEDQVLGNSYDYREISGMLSYTSHDVMLDDLIQRPIQSGDALSNANTVILMGRTRDGNRVGRALYVAKHRGSMCDDSILPFTINESGLHFT